MVVDDTPPGLSTHDRDTHSRKMRVGRGLKDCTDEDIIFSVIWTKSPIRRKLRKSCRILIGGRKSYHFAQRLLPIVI